MENESANNKDTDSIQEKLYPKELENSLESETLLNNTYLKEIIALQRENEYLNLKITSLQNTIAQLPDNIESHPDTIRLNKEIERSNKEIDRLNATLERSNKEIERSKKEIGSLNATLERANKETERSKKETERSNKEIVRLNKKIDNYRNSSAFQAGELLVNALRKPGANTLLMPFRLTRLFLGFLFKQKAS